VRHWWLLVYALFFVALNWPVLALVNRIEPRIAGVPFLVAWYLFWAFTTAIFHAILLFSRRSDPSLPEPASDEEGAK